MDWPSVIIPLKSLSISPPPLSPTHASLELLFDTNLDRISSLLIQHTPYRRPFPRAKPSWSPLLSTLRKEFHSASRPARKSNLPSDWTAARLSKSGYFKAIKKAKAAHWSSLLSTATPQNIWITKKLALGKTPPRFPDLPEATTPQKIYDNLLAHFFPPLSPRSLRSHQTAHVHCPPILPSEVSSVLAKCSPSSAPGPDSVPYSVWKIVHVNSPHLLPSLLSPLLKFGYHPTSLEKENGVVLDKPGKPSYDSPSSFRIIVLLQTISKVLERLVAVSVFGLARSL